MREEATLTSVFQQSRAVNGGTELRRSMWSLLCFQLQQLQPDLQPLPAEHLVLNLQSVPVGWDKLYKSSCLYVMNRCGRSVSDVDAAVGMGAGQQKSSKVIDINPTEAHNKPEIGSLKTFLTQPCTQSCNLQPLLLHPWVEWFQNDFEKWPHLVTVKAARVFSAGVIKLWFDLWLLM